MRALTLLRKLALLLAAIIMMVPMPALAITADNRASIGSDSLYYWEAQQTPCGTNTIGQQVTTSSPSPTSTWSSGAQPPYYLEQFIIEVLKDLASKEGVPTTNTVTQEHVVALVAWAYAEGGNITNTDAFNPWNGGITSRPDLVAGATNGAGVQSFKSFDAGVEANAIMLVGSNQNRIGAALSKVDTTAEQIEHAIAYYDETPGNQAWAWGPTPKDQNSVLQFNHSTYINSLLSDLSSTRGNYAQQASVEIGPGQENTNHVDNSHLQYSGGTSNSGSTPGSSASGQCSVGDSVNCTTATGDTKILCEAERYKDIYYLYAGGHQGYAAFIAGCPNPDAAKATSTAGNQGPCATDCSGLVSVAVDSAFGQNYMWVVHNNMQGAGGDLWKPIPIASATAGDIVTTPDHVEIVVSVVGNSVNTFGSHHTGTKTGPVTSSISNWTGGAWHWTGPGSS